MNTSIRVVNDSYHEHKLLWPYHAQKAEAILRGEIPSPSLIEMDPTDEGCNQSCIDCCFQSSRLRKVISIDVPKMLRFVAQAYTHGTYAFELVGGGEPTVHRNIAGIITGIATLARPGLERPHIGMVTNGVLLKRIFPVAHHLDFVRVSLDSANEKTYATLHGIPAILNHHASVIENIRNLRASVGIKRVRIGYLVVPPYNHRAEEIRACVKLAHELDVGHIAFRPAYMDRKVDVNLWREAAQAIQEQKQRCRPGFVLGGSGGSWDYALGQRGHPHGPCRTKPLVLTIKANGDIPSCFLYRERLEERPRIGHISEGFENVWFSKRNVESIQAVNRSDCPDVCKLFRADQALDKLEQAGQSGAVILTPADNELDDPYFI